MKRTVRKIAIKNAEDVQKKLLLWAQQFEVALWLDSNSYPQQFSTFSSALAVNPESKLSSNYKNAFAKLKSYRNSINDYCFGYLSYDLKNDIEDLTTENIDNLHFPDLYFFQPKKLFFLYPDALEVQYLEKYAHELNSDLDAIFTFEERVPDTPLKSEVKIHKRISKKEYINAVNELQEHIHRGDIYEVNFCQEFYAKEAIIDPLQVYTHLNEISTPPFATFLKLKGKYLLSASPERFVKREGTKVISQPIKGTAKRHTNSQKDMFLAQALEANEKERAENIMIVDLVRNDLAKTAIKGSVHVEELCKVYSFKQVHQLISTVTSQVSTSTDSVAIIKSLFPMGSMTGAPKIAAMKLIEKLEVIKRSLYSGAIGYFTPSHNFDFNVVIRSILYNEQQRYLSYSVGGAITAKSDPEKEYEECLIKAIAMKKALLF